MKIFLLRTSLMPALLLAVLLSTNIKANNPHMACLIKIDNTVDAMKTDMTTSFAGTWTAIDAHLVDNNADLAIIEGKIDTIDTEVGVIDGKVNTIDTEVGIIDSKVDIIDTEVGVIDGKVDTMTTLVSTNTTTLATHTTTLATIIATLATMDGKLDSIITLVTP